VDTVWCKLRCAAPTPHACRDAIASQSGTQGGTQTGAEGQGVMNEEEPKLTWIERLRWWLYGKCFAYCVHCMHPEADADEFSVIDNTNFLAVSKNEIVEIMNEAPGVAWRFQAEVNTWKV
jgi:hypothetical protein